MNNVTVSKYLDMAYNGDNIQYPEEEEGIGYQYIYVSMPFARLSKFNRQRLSSLMAQIPSVFDVDQSLDGEPDFGIPFRDMWILKLDPRFHYTGDQIKRLIVNPFKELAEINLFDIEDFEINLHEYTTREVLNPINIGGLINL